MLAHLVHKIIDKSNPAVWIVALELEGFCTQASLTLSCWRWIHTPKRRSFLDWYSLS